MYAVQYNAVCLRSPQQLVFFHGNIAISYSSLRIEYPENSKSHHLCLFKKATNDGM